MLAFLVLSGVLSESALGHLEVRRRLPRELFAGAPSTLAIEITNTSRRFPAYAVAIEDLLQPAGEEPGYQPVGRMFALRIAPGATELRAYRWVPAQRGPLRLAGFRVSTRFPFGLFAKACILELASDALVYPAVSAASRPRAAHVGEGEGLTGPSRPETGSEVVGLRPFSPGDSLRRVHWRATLRRGTPVVRQTEEPRASEAAIYLATRGPHPGERFEQSVRRAASQAVHLLAAGARVSLRTDAIFIPADHGARQRARLLAFLARVAPDASTP